MSVTLISADSLLDGYYEAINPKTSFPIHYNLLT